MKRRNFVVAGIVLLGTFKAMAAKTKQSIGLGSSPVLDILDKNGEIVYLKRGSVAKLPDNPTPMQTVIHFNVTKYRFGKSPVILANGQNVNGEKKEEIIVTKDVYLNKRPDFYLQYTGPDVGWVILC